MRFTRREFLRGMGAVVGITGSAKGAFEVLAPFVVQPENVVPGVATWYATACRECPAGCGMLVKNLDGRVIKCEGNPIHPVNRGRLCARGQASLQGLYDPDRFTGPRKSGSDGFEAVGWGDALAQVALALRGRRVAVVSGLETGALRSLITRWLGLFAPGSYHIMYEPVDYGAIKAVYGGVVPSFDIAHCDFLISFGADFLETWVSPVQYAEEFTSIRRIEDGRRAPFFYVGPRVSTTAANADGRVLVRPGEEEQFALAVVREMAGGTVSGPYAEDAREISRLLRGARAPLALPGLHPSAANAAAIINSVTGTALVNPGRPHALSLIFGSAGVQRLIDDLNAGDVEAVVTFGSNPVYSLPNSGEFVEALRGARAVVSLSSYMDETAVRAQWVLPSHTSLESWGDYEPYPDVHTLLQPTMGPVFDTRHTGDILMQLASRSARVSAAGIFGASDFRGYLRNSWDSAGEARGWEACLQLGGRWLSLPAPDVRWVVPSGWEPSVTAGIAASPAGPILSPRGGPTEPFETEPPQAGAREGTIEPLALLPAERPPREGQLALYAFPHVFYYDGRGANKRWLQENPEPVLRTVWGTWAELHPHTANALGVGTDDMIEIISGGSSVRVPAYVWEGVAPRTVAVPLGEGHKHYGRYAEGLGVNVYPLLGSPVPSVKVRGTGDGEWVTRIKGSTDQHDRGIVRTASIWDQPFHRGKITMPMPEGYGFSDFYPPYEYKQHRWAMVVDLDRCIGCHACVTACYAENNVPVVGPEGIWHKREMSWLRVDTYIDWDRKRSPVLFQPMLCQQCDAAPCESVCPVFASAHNEEGINMQIYNRCVGTRDCSNNCPYKVRRFEWYNAEWPFPLNWQLNPDVTVRSRGVMEKCTFCIQRIRTAELVALREKRRLREGEVVPACVETCPTGALVFGDLKNPDSEVSRLIRSDPRAYQVLVELNTKPAVIYLKKVVA